MSIFQTAITSIWTTTTTGTFCVGAATFPEAYFV
jgi:hypothetical protein